MRSADLGGKRSYLNESDREVLSEFIKARVEKSDYSDKSIVKEFNVSPLAKDIEINIGHVKRVRSEYGIKLGGAGKAGGKKRGPKRRSAGPSPAKKGFVSRRKKDPVVGDNHPVTIGDLLQALETAAEGVEKAKDVVAQFQEQEKARLGI